MYVENKIMYHISRKTDWKIGDIIVAGKADNLFWEISKNYSLTVTVNDLQMSIFEMVDKKYSFDISKQNIDFLYDKIGELAKEFSFFVRETVFEEYRKQNCDHLPSRQKCLWVADKDSLCYWKTLSENEPQSLLTLELKGDLFCADEKWLSPKTFSSVEAWERAKHYWAGEMTDYFIKEYLFYGEAIVRKIELL